MENFLFIAPMVISLYLAIIAFIYIHYYNELIRQQEQIAQLEKMLNSLAKRLKENQRKTIRGFKNN